MRKEIVAFCADNSLEPAPADGSVKYTLSTEPVSPQTEKVTELIVVANALQNLYTACGQVAEPDDILPEPDWRKRLPPSWMGTVAVDEAPQYGPGELLELLRRIEEEGWYAFIPGAPEPDWKKRLPPSWMGAEAVQPFSIGPFELQSPLALPGTLKFGLKDLFELKPALTYMENGKETQGTATFANPAGDVEVSVGLTDNPDIVEFNINSLNGSSPSLKVQGEDRGDINVSLNSPEKSTGILNIKTGEVIGTASLKALGEKYKKPFPVAVSYRGNLNFPTRELNLEVSGISFEPVKLQVGPYQQSQPEKFWGTVHLYSVWGETNNIGKKELTTLMTEQFMADYPEEKAKKLADMVSNEILDKVKQVQVVQEKLAEEEFDFSKLDPTLKWRKM